MHEGTSEECTSEAEFSGDASGLIALGRHCVGSRFETDLYESATSELMANHSVQTGRNIYGVDSFSLTGVVGQPPLYCRNELPSAGFSG